MSITGLNANAAKGTLPAMKHRAEDEKVVETGKEGKATTQAPVAYMPQGTTGGEQIARVSPKGMDAPYSGTPLRTPARILRIWLAPFEDTDMDLHDQKYVYMTIHAGRWVLEANQVNVQPQFKQVFPLGRKDADEKEDRSRPGPAVDANGEPLAATGKGR
jgi:conjugal transfer pilus assembly protein TraV